MRLIMALMIATTCAYASAQTTLIEAEAPSGFAYSANWTQIVDGAYTYMLSSTNGDTVSFDVPDGSIWILRETFSNAAASVRICNNANCSSFSNISSVRQYRVPIAFIVEAGTVTLTNQTPNAFRFDAIIISEASELVSLPVDPQMAYFDLDGQVVALDYSFNAGDILISILLAIMLPLLVATLVVIRDEGQ